MLRFCGAFFLKTFKGVLYMYKMDNQTKYAIQLAMLQKLVRKEAISTTEYNAIKATLKKRYKTLDLDVA